MTKVKVKTLIGSVVTVAFFMTVIVAILLYAFPENVASATGFGPYDGQRILTFCAILVAALFLLGWLTEKAFDIAGTSGLYFHWGQKKSQITAPVTNTIASEDDDEQPVFSEEAVTVPRFIRRRRRPGRQRILQNHWLNACAASSYSSKPLPVYNIMRLPVLRGTPDLVLIRTVTRWPHSGPCMRKTTHS